METREARILAALADPDHYARLRAALHALQGEGTLPAETDA
jgi:hypothetical protein